MRFSLACLYTLAVSLPAMAQSRCPLTPYGRTCGAELTASVTLDGTNRVLDLELTKALGSTLGFSVIGAWSVQVPLPGGCDLLAQAVLLDPFLTDSNGRASHTYRIPYGWSLTIFMQDVVLVPTQSGTQFRTSNGVRVGHWHPILFHEEPFSVDRSNPKLGIAWNNGFLTPGRLGGSGVLGEFRASAGTLRGKDAKNRSIYEWNTDKIDIPGSWTLDGKPHTITNGILDFQSFVIAANEHVRFVGTKVPQIRATGLIKIDGAISMPVSDAPLKNVDSRRGAFGLAGPAGGARGGQGGDIPSYVGGQIAGRQGGVVTVPAGHPRQGQAAATGGPGSPAAPASGKDTDAVWIIQSNFKIWCRQIAAGGTGGSFWDSGNKSCLGKQGSTRKTSNTPIWPYDPLGREFGKPGPPSLAFPVLPVITGRSSLDTFLISGAAGGGAGAHVLHSNSAFVQWTAGAAGGSGNGAIGLQAGRDFVVGNAAEIDLRGGAASNSLSKSTPGVPAPGGGGTGGSLLAQCGGKASVLGEINVLGGAGGTLTDNALVHVESKGGAGGCGFIRIEADPAPNRGQMPKLKPAATPDNVGLLRAVDDDPVSMAASRWYDVGFVPAAWHYYVIRANVDGVPIVFSDNPLLAARKADATAPVLIYLQSGKLDAQGKLLGPPTPWAIGEIDAINDSSNKGNGYRFLIRLDRKKTFTGIIVIDSVRVYLGG